MLLSSVARQKAVRAQADRPEKEALAEAVATEKEALAGVPATGKVGPAAGHAAMVIAKINN